MAVFPDFPSFSISMHQWFFDIQLQFQMNYMIALIIIWLQMSWMQLSMDTQHYYEICFIWYSSNKANRMNEKMFIQNWLSSPKITINSVFGNILFYLE